MKVLIYEYVYVNILKIEFSFLSYIRLILNIDFNKISY